MGLVLAVTAIIIALILLDARRETGEITEHVKVRRLSLSTEVSDVFAGPIPCNDAEALANAVRETRIRRELAYLFIFPPTACQYMKKRTRNCTLYQIDLTRK